MIDGHKSCWKACRFGWFSIFWINSRTLVLCACFTTEYGKPGIWNPCLPRSPSSVHGFCHEQQWIFPLFHEFLFNVERVHFKTYLRIVLYWTCLNNWSPCSVMSLLNMETLPVFRWTWLNFLFQQSEKLSSSVKEWTLISCERVVFLSSCMSSNRPDLSRIGFRSGWVDWTNLVCRTTSPSGCRTTFKPSLVPLSIRNVLRSLVEIEVTCQLFV